MFDHDEFDPSDDEYGFWKDVPTGRLERLTQRLPRITHRHDAITDREPAPEHERSDAPRREPTLGLRRPVSPTRPVGSRSHGDTTGSIPVVSASVGQRVRGATEHIDPLLRRVGALAVVITLAVPVALSMRGGHQSAAGLTPDHAAAAAPVVASTDQPAGQPTDPPASESTALDPRSLPPATYSPSYTATSHTETTATAPQRATAAPQRTATTTATTVAATKAKQVEAVNSPSCATTYTVTAGDYWILVAKKVGVSLSQLLSANNASTATALYPGRTICLPSNASVPTTAAPATTVKPAKPVATTAKPVVTTPPTTTKPPTVTVPTKTNYTRAEVEAIIREVWPDDLEDMAVLIATRESNLVPTAKNYCCYGLFQIYWGVHQGWLANIGVTSAQQLFDPRVNAFAALIMYNRSGGWGPWKL